MERQLGDTGLPVLQTSDAFLLQICCSERSGLACVMHHFHQSAKGQAGKAQKGGCNFCCALPTKAAAFRFSLATNYRQDDAITKVQVI